MQLANFLSSLKSKSMLPSYSRNFDRVSCRKWGKVAVFTLAALIPILLPVVHMLIFLALFGKNNVNESSCRCSCWDAVFKGAYETGEKAGYKHVYFNSNRNTFQMWTATVFFVLILYESFKHFFSLLLHSKLRWSMGALFLCSLHNQYYAWWSLWNFLNDDFYQLWNHQMFFTLSEGVSFALVLLSLDSSKDIQSLHVIGIVSIALFHILASAKDQFVLNVILGEGGMNEVFRDVAFMVSDLLFMVISLYELRRYAAVSKGVSLWQFLLNRRNVKLICFLLFGMFLFVTVYPSEETIIYNDF